MRNKRWIDRLYLVFATLGTIAIVVANLAMQSREFSELAVSTDQYIAVDGALYDLRDDKQGVDWLRRISPDGTLEAQLAFPESESASLGVYVRRSIVGVEGDDVVIHEYRNKGTAHYEKYEKLISYNMQTGEGTQLIDLLALSNSGRWLASTGLLDGIAYVGQLLQDGTSHELALYAIDCSEKLSSSVNHIPLAAEMKDLVALACLPSGDVLLTAQDSTIWIYNGTRWRNYDPPADRRAMSSVSVTEAGSIYTYWPDVQGGTIFRMLPDEQAFRPWKDTAGTVALAHIAGENTLLLQHTAYAGLDAEANIYYTLSHNGSERSISSLSVPFRMLWNGRVVWRMVWQCGLLWLAGYALRHCLLRRETRLIVKQILLAAPVFVVGLVLIAGAIERQLTDTLYQDQLGRLMLDAQGVVDMLDQSALEGISWSNPLQDPNYANIKTTLVDQSKVTTTEWIDIHHYTSYWLFRIEDGEAYAAVSGSTYINLNNRFVDKDVRFRIYNGILQSGKAAKEEVFSSRGEGTWLSAFFPIKNDAGEIIAVLEAGSSTAAIDKEIESIVTATVGSIAAVMCLSLLVYIVVLAVSLRALSKLKEGAQAIAMRKYDTRVHVRTTDETQAIAKAFNDMADSVETSDRQTRAVRDGYRLFVPEKMLDILEKKSIEEVTAGDQTGVHATYLLLSVEGLYSFRSHAYIDALNRFYTCILPHITQAGGLVERYGGGALHAIFEGPPDAPLQALIEMYAALDRMYGHAVGAAFERVRCHALLSRSETTLGVIGNENRLHMIVVNGFTYQSQKVAHLCASLGCRTLLTRDSNRDMGELAHAYRKRLIGYILDTGERSPLYDYYDGEPAKLMREIDATKALFEQGIEAYYSATYAQARKLFIEVIKQSPDDLAAREYLRESHERMLSGNPPQMLLEL